MSTYVLTITDPVILEKIKIYPQKEHSRIQGKIIMFFNEKIKNLLLGFV